MDESERIKKEIDEIRRRNMRVEMDKAWETSPFRRVLIAILTYIVAVLFFYFASLPRPFVSAIIPTIGFILSTLSVSYFKKIWINRVKKPKSIKAVIFDLNGIFIQSPKLSDRFEKDFGISSEVFLKKLSEIMEITRKPEAGRAFKYWAPVLEEWKIKLTESEFWDYWFGIEKPSEDMINFAKKLRSKGIKVFVLSNNFKERAEYYGHYPWITEAVDKLYFSWQTGFVKPDIKAWEFVLSDNNLKPDDCIYFDDQEKNLKAAKDAGIKAFMFTNEFDLEEIVESYLE